MSPDELTAFMPKFNSCSSLSHTTYSELAGGTQTSIGNCRSSHKTRDTSLNKNSINTPKNLQKFTFLKGKSNTNTSIPCEDKNTSLPKTASTINNNTQTTLDHQPGTINHIGAKHSRNQHETSIDRKQISKELLSQIHMCRFVYKLLQRVMSTLQNCSNDLKTTMAGFVFDRLSHVQSLSCLFGDQKIKEYKKTQDYQKIHQIIQQYQKKYEKDIGYLPSKWDGLRSFDSQLSSEIKKIYDEVKRSDELVGQTQQKVIVLDYLITLKQLTNLLEKNDIEMFHEKSKIEAIVEGAPAKHITPQHVRAISAKLKAIKLL